MKKIIINNLSSLRENLFIKYFIIPFFLLLFAIFSTSIVYSNSSFSILVRNYDLKNIINKPNGVLLKGTMVVGQFKANDNYLGIIEVRFNNFNRINSDSVRFRIKEKNSKSWYYSNLYKVDQFQPHSLFPFGFPIIQTSKDKNYVFEIESLNGKKGDAVALDKFSPVFTTKYQYPKRTLISSPIIFSTHVLKKSLNFLTNVDFLSPTFKNLFTLE